MSRARDLADGTFSGAFSADSPTLVVDATNNRVGVGTASPGDKLTLAGTAAYMLIDRSDGEAGVTFKYNSDNTKRADLAVQTNGDLRIKTNLAERMRVLSGGGVAIGTSNSPNNAPLLVHCATDDNIRIKQETHAAIQAVNDSASAFVELKLDGSSLFLNSQSGGNVGIGTTSPAQKFHVEGGKTLINSNNSSHGQFQIGGVNTGEASMAFVGNITASGDSPTSSSGNNAVFVAGSGIYGLGADNWGIGNKGRGSWICRIPYNATGWTFNSDERLKNIEGEVENALDKINGIRAVYYNWKNDEAQQRQVGVIAQDIHAVLPEAVSVPETETNENGSINYLGVTHTDLIPLLIASVKELNTKVEACEAKNTEQQALIEDLQTRLAALETP